MGRIYADIMKIAKNNLNGRRRTAEVAEGRTGFNAQPGPINVQ
jgi:hypothetical protein